MHSLPSSQVKQSFQEESHTTNRRKKRSRSQSNQGNPLSQGQLTRMIFHCHTSTFWSTTSRAMKCSPSWMDSQDTTQFCLMKKIGKRQLELHLGVPSAIESCPLDSRMWWSFPKDQERSSKPTSYCRNLAGHYFFFYPLRIPPWELGQDELSERKEQANKASFGDTPNGLRGEEHSFVLDI